MPRFNCNFFCNRCKIKAKIFHNLMSNIHNYFLCLFIINKRIFIVMLLLPNFKFLGNETKDPI
jgi:hypothetical protein